MAAKLGLVLDCVDPNKLAEDDAVEEHGNRWVVMADPEGNEFCVCNGGATS